MAILRLWQKCPLAFRVLIAFTAVLFLGIAGYQLDRVWLRHNLDTYREELKKQGVKFNLNEVFSDSSPASIKAGNELIQLCNFPPREDPFEYFFIRTNNHRCRISQLPVPRIDMSWSIIATNLESNKIAIQKIIRCIQNTNIAFSVPHLTLECYAEIPSNSPYLRSLHSLHSARTLFKKAELYHLHQGNSSEAFADLMAFLRIHRLIQKASKLSPVYSLLNVCCLCVWELIENNSCNDSQLREIQNSVEEIDLFQELQENLDVIPITEPLFFAQAKKEFFSNSEYSSPLLKRVAEFFMDAIRSPSRSFEYIVYDLKGQDWYARSYLLSEKHYLEYNFFWQQVFQQTKGKTPWSILLKNSTYQYDRLKTQNGTKIGIEEPCSDYLIEKFCLSETMRRMMITAITLKRFQLKHGHYPENLSELVPDYLSAIPIDPMSQKPFAYHPHPQDGYWLYSVGINGIDEMSKGLAPKQKLFISPSFRLKKNESDDLSWPRPASKTETEAEIKRMTELIKKYQTPDSNKRRRHP